MSGIFSRWQPRYAEKGIATFPVGETKKPCVRGWHKASLKYSRVLATKFSSTDALGYVTGRRSKVTVLDIDTTDEKIVEDAIGRHGQPAIVTRTASGKRHLLYRYNGERRRIRPWPDLAIDLLGDNGFALAAPSKLATGSYEIIHGHFDDLANLKPAENIERASAPAERLRGMREHDGRNGALFLAIGPPARQLHQAHGTWNQLLDIALKLNAECAEPMEDKEVTRIVDSVWGMTLEGRNVIGMPTAFCLMVDHLDDIDSDAAFRLLAFLRAHQGPHAHFMCTNTLAGRFGWGREKIAAARHELIEKGYLVPTRQSGRGHPALFRWGRY